MRSIKTLIQPLLLAFVCGVLPACQDAAGERIPAGDAQARAVLQRAAAEMSTSRRISPENFEQLRAVYEKYPRVGEVRQTYRSALIIRDDIDGLEKLLTGSWEADLTPGDRLDLGRVFIRNGKYERSLGILEPLVRSDPGNLDVRGLRGLALFHLGRLDEAGAELDTVWPALIANKRADEIAARGLIHYRQGNVEKALVTLEAALKADPEHITALYTLSRIHAEQGDDERAGRYRRKIDELHNREKAETYEKSRLVKLTRDLREAWEKKRHREVIDLANKMLAQVKDRRQRSVLYQYLYESYKALGMDKEAESVLAEVRRLNTK